MSLAGGLIAFVGGQAARRFDQATRDPLRTQTELLQRILQRNADTEYGRRCRVLLDQHHRRVSARGAARHVCRYPAGHGARGRGREERLYGGGSRDVRADQRNDGQTQVRSGHADRSGARPLGSNAHLALPRTEGARRHPRPQDHDDGFAGHRRSHGSGASLRIYVRTHL